MEDVGFLPGLMTFLLLCVLGVLVMLVTRAHRRTLRFQVGLFLAAFAIRFAMSIVIYDFGLVHLLKDEDGSGWVVGIYFQQEWERQGIGLLGLPAALASAYQAHNRGYHYMLAALFYVMSPTRLAPAALNGFFGSLTIIYAYRTARVLFSPFVAHRVGVWLCVFPSLIIWASQTIKEPVVMLLEGVALYGCAVILRRGFSLAHLASTTAAIILLIPFRFYAAYLTALAMVLAVISHQFLRKGIRVGPILGILATGSFLVMSGLLAGRESPIEQFDLHYVERMRNWGALGGSGVRTDFDVKTGGGLGLGMLVGAAHVLLAPFPWQFSRGSTRMLMVGPEMVYWWWLFVVGVVPGVAYNLRRRFFVILPLFVFLMGFGILYSVTFSNVGLVYRQRAQLLPWLLILAASGIERRLLRRREARMTRTLKSRLARTPFQ